MKNKSLLDKLSVFKLQIINGCQTILRLFQIETVVVFAILLSGSLNVHAQAKCENLFIQTERKQITTLDDLGQAMTQGMLLDAKSNDIFEFYRKIFFGDATKNFGGKNLITVTALLKDHPELQKPHFTEYNVTSVEKNYEPTENLNRYLKSQNTTAGQARSNLFQIDANLGYWKKILDYKDQTILESLSKDEKKELSKKQNLRFETYLNRLINKTNRQILADLKNESLDYDKKAASLFNTLKHINNWMEKKNRNTQSIRQAMVDLVHTVGYGNQAVQVLLKSKNGLDKIEGLKKLMDESNALAVTLGYKNILEIQNEMRIDFPTGLSKNESPNDNIKNLESELMKTSPTVKTVEAIRVRSLSIQEAPFRSCLGGDCSSSTYFSKALDPNFYYFTMTDKFNHSEGHATVVLGEALNPLTQKLDKVAFLDKLQNVQNNKIEIFLTAISLSLKEKGIDLTLPDDVGDHNGLSNIDRTRHFVDKEILSVINSKRNNFKPFENIYKFENRFSRSYSSPNVQIFQPRNLTSNVEITRGLETSTTYAGHISPEPMLKHFLTLKDSSQPEDLIRFINTDTDFIVSLRKLKLYSITRFKDDLTSIMNNKSLDYKIRKQATYKLSFMNNKVKVLFDFYAEKFQNPKDIAIIEAKNFDNTNDKIKKFLYQTLIMKPFETALDKDDAKTIQYYLDQYKINPNTINLYSFSLIGRAIARRSDKIANLLLNHPQIDLNAKDNNGNTPIMYASAYGQFDIFNRIYNNAKTDILGKDVNGRSILQLATLANNKEVISLLIQNPAIDINSKDSSGNTILMNLVDNSNVEMVKMFLKLPNVDLQTINNEGQKLIHIAATSYREDILDIVIKNTEFDINAKDNNGQSALMTAVRSGSFRNVKLLLAQSNVDLNAKDNNGQTTLMMAVKSGVTKNVEFLLTLPNVDVNIKANNGRSALIEAFDSYDGQESAKLLLMHPMIDVNVIDENGKSALSLAKAKDFRSIAKLLKNKGAR